MATITAGRRALPRPVPSGPLVRLGDALWALLTSVDFAVVQIIALALLAVVGMTLRQLPDSAFHSATDYANRIADLHTRYDPAFGASVVDTLERLQLFQVFRSTWFSIGLVVLLVSILACTIDRTPRLWRQVADIRVVQPDPYFDLSLPDRAAIDAVPLDGLRSVLRRHGFRLREAVADGATYVYGDRHRYTKLATLLSHAGLILFLVAGAVTSLFGDEAGLVVPVGQSLTVQPIGTPGLLLVKNYDFEAPGLATGQATDYRTDLAVFQDGRQIARKTIRVNDPLSVAGYTFHQNGYGPAPDIDIRDRTDGRILWSGSVPLTNQAAGLPYGTMAVPGRALGLQLLLQRGADGTAIVLFLPYRVTGTAPDGSAQTEDLAALALEPGETGTAPTLDFTVGLRDVSSYSLLIAKRDPGQGIVWLAFLLLIGGLLVTFYLPRRRVWARLHPDGSLALVARAERYVDLEREFGQLLDALVAVRDPGRPADASPPATD
ncbi:MAG TPA: cytochrome c biogenesis protein ResB [Candidatus Dormibacteraeota bacterium]|nr:cytochrome c biogenesis protein ResB [Candidatus Dormibacteraeota bacterium]